VQKAQFKDKRIELQQKLDATIQSTSK